MSFDTIDQSVQSATPVELYTFQSTTSTWYRTSYENDVTFGGHTYTAVPGGRDSISIVDMANDQAALAVDILATDAIAQNFVAGVPPDSLQITVTRYYPSYGVSLQFWQGYASSISFKGRFASFRVPNGTFDALSCDVPNVSATRHCNNVLYDAQCGITPAGSAFSMPFSVTRTITSISADGRTIGLSSATPSTPLNNYSVHGNLVHNSTGLQRSIIGEATNGLTVTLATQFPNSVLNIGDSITVQAGCDHTMSASCSAKFNNAVNFGGIPNLPPSNIFDVGLLAARYGA